MTTKGRSFGKIFIIIITILIVFIIAINTKQVSYAHGVVYSMQKIDNANIKVTLRLLEDSNDSTIKDVKGNKDSSDSKHSEDKVINILYYNLENAKVLNIGFEIINGKNQFNSIDLDIKSCILPIKVNLINVNKKNWIPFSDIVNVSAKQYICHLHDAGIVSGKPDGKFYPNGAITRAEFIVMVMKTLEVIEKRPQPVQSKTLKFKDLGSHWAKDILLDAASKGIISGYTDNTIRPDNSITLGESCVIIDRVFKFKTIKDGIFGKLKHGMWYSSAVKKMFQSSILDVSDNLYKNFDENIPVNRADCAVMLSRALTTY